MEIRVNNTITDYDGGFIYKEEQNYQMQNGFLLGNEMGHGLQFFAHAEGYVEPNGNNFAYIYQYKDHLGNIRLSYSDKDGNGTIVESSDPNLNEIVEENNYYPFGLKHKGYYTNVTSTNPALDYKYNGVEFEECLGLDLYEMDWRHYDPATGRFITIDLAAKVYESLTPYNYSKNNPILFIDPTGLMGEAFASTVVNSDGVVIDHIPDDDDSIYLNSRRGTVVGAEEDGVEYKIGDKIFEVDEITDTYFELVLKEIEYIENIRNHIKIYKETVSSTKLLIDKLERGEELTQLEILSLNIKLNLAKGTFLLIKSEFEKLEAVYELFKKHSLQPTIGDFFDNWYNSVVNNIDELFGDVSPILNQEVPDGTGRKIRNLTTDKGINKLKREPSNYFKNVKEVGQKLPYSLESVIYGPSKR